MNKPRPPAWRRIPQAKFYYSRMFEAPLLEVLARLFSSGRFEQILMIISGCSGEGPVGRATAGAASFGGPLFLGRAALQPELNPEAFREVRYRLGEGEGLQLHHQLYGIAAA